MSLIFIQFWIFTSPKTKTWVKMVFPEVANLSKSFKACHCLCWNVEYKLLSLFSGQCKCPRITRTFVLQVGNRCPRITCMVALWVRNMTLSYVRLVRKGFDGSSHKGCWLCNLHSWHYGNKGWTINENMG